MNINEPCLRHEIETAQNLVLPDNICLVHGDLDSRHLIFDNKVLTGIIDWGDTDITSPAVDLDIMWTFFGPVLVSEAIAFPSIRGFSPRSTQPIRS